LRVSHSTVNAVRKDLESDGQLVQQKTIITKDGKSRPRKALEDSGKKNETGNNGAESRPCGIRLLKFEESDRYFAGSG